MKILKRGTNNKKLFPSFFLLTIFLIASFRKIFVVDIFCAKRNFTFFSLWKFSLRNTLKMCTLKKLFLTRRAIIFGDFREKMMYGIKISNCLFWYGASKVHKSPRKLITAYYLAIGLINNVQQEISLTLQENFEKKVHKWNLEKRFSMKSENPLDGGFSFSVQCYQ